MSWHAWRVPTYVAAPGERVRCPACRRPVAADMLQPTGPMPARARARLRRPEAVWACDACRATLERQGHMSREEYLQALGAPAAVVTRLTTRRGRDG